MHADHQPGGTGCPAWCTGFHDPTETEDGSHRSTPWPVAVIERRAGGEGPYDRIAATELAVGVEVRWGETWVWITPEDDVRRGLVLTRESAQRLIRALDGIFDEVTLGH